MEEAEHAPCFPECALLRMVGGRRRSTPFVLCTITVGSSKMDSDSSTPQSAQEKPTVIEQHHCQFKTRTSTDDITAGSYHQLVVIGDFTAGFWGPLIIF